MFIVCDGKAHIVLEVATSSPSARGATTMIKAKIRDLVTGAVQDKTFRSNDKFEEPDVERTSASLMYTDAQGYHFMEDSTYEQFSFDETKIADLKGYLKEGVPVQALKCNGQILSLELPAYVELKVASTEPGIKGATASGSSTKKAVLETGLEVRVPMYIAEGEVVRVNTQTGEVGGRA